MNRLLSFIILAAVCITSAASGKTDKYKALADTVREQVWAMDIPEFNDFSRQHPDFDNRSAVVVAAYREICAKKKTGIAFNVDMLTNIFSLPLKATPQIHSTDLYRRLIKINDNAALEKFSEFEISTNENTGNFLNFWAYYKEDIDYVIGVRIIKPDGRIVVVDTDDFTDVKEGKKEKELKQKLAVPGLETGDMIDVFFYTQSKLKNAHLDPVTIYMRDEYPVLSYRIHCEFDDNLTSQIRTFNGAPEFTCRQAENKDYIIDALRSEPIGEIPRLWYNPIRQSPAVYIAVFNRRNKMDYTPKSARKDGIQLNPDASIIHDDAWNQVKNVNYSGSFFNTLTGHLDGSKKVTGRLKKMLEAGEITPRQAAAYIYNLLSFSYGTNKFKYYRNDFVYYFREFLKMAGVKESEILLTTPDTMEPVDEAICGDMIFWTCRTKADSLYYFPINGLTAPGEIPAEFIGATAMRQPPKKKKDDTGLPLETVLPSSTPDENTGRSVLDISLDGTTMHVTRQEENTGSRKNIMSDILVEEDIVNGYLKYLNRYGLTIGLKENKKEKQARSERYSDARKEQTKNIRNEIAAYHSTEAVELKDYSIAAIGIDPDSAALVYRMDYTVDGLVKRAGRNLTLAVGSLMSPQTEVRPSDRIRSDDVSMISPRRFETSIDIRLPEGYRVSAKSLASLQADVSNATGFFTAKASVADGHLIIDIVKQYEHKTEKAANWPELTKILDAATRWRNSTVALEK